MDNDFHKKTTGYEDMFWAMPAELQKKVLDSYISSRLFFIASSETPEEAEPVIVELHTYFGSYIAADEILAGLLQDAIDLVNMSDDPAEDE